jgi:hypothetical protein
MSGRLVTPAQLAAHLGVSRNFIYEHSDELGGLRLGSGPRARLRFDVEDVRRRLSSCLVSRGSAAPESAPGPASRSRRRARTGSSVQLLPIRGEIRGQTDSGAVA